MAESFSVKAILSAADRGFTSTMKSASSYVNNLKSTLTSGIGFGVMMAAGQKAFDVVSNGVTGLIGDMNDASAAWKTFQGNMEMNGHTADEIRSIKGELQDFAEATIYSSSDMASTFAQLEAVGTKNTTKLVKGFGGLAAAAESPTQAMKTLSQQATQMAAKPTVAWEDFKLMLEQTPAGIAAVSKQMGMSTQDMIKNVQDGKIATEDFFDAIAKVGTNEAFTKMATEYKTVDQAMDGLTETVSNKLAPAFDKISSIGIGGIEKVIDFVSQLDGEALAASISVDTLKNAASQLGVVLGGAAVAVGGADIFGSLISSAQEYGFTLTDAFNGVKNAAGQVTGKISGIGNALKSVSIDSAAGKIKGGFDGIFKKVKSVGDSVTDFGINISNSFDTISSKLSNRGMAIGSVFGDIGIKISEASSKASSGVGSFVNNVSSKLSGIVGKVKTIATPIANVFSGIESVIGPGLQKSANVGISVMNGMVSSLTSIMGVAMSALGPAAILGVVLAGLGVLDSQFGAEIDSLISIVATKGPQIIEGLANSITSKLPTLIQTGAELLTGFMNAINGNLSVVISSGVQIITALVQGVGSNIGILLPSAVNLVTTFVSGILNAIPQLLLAGMQLLQSLSEGVLSNIGLITASASSIIQGFTNSIMTNLPGIISAGLQIMMNLAQGAIQAVPQLLVVGLTAIATIITGISNQIPQIMQTGVQIIQMLIQGLVQNLPNI